MDKDLKRPFGIKFLAFQADNIYISFLDANTKLS
jgi:hypothetical protein